MADDKAAVDGDLKGAIAQYQAIVDAFLKTNRRVAAEALVRIADCYEKLGNAQAKAVYERVVRDFGDQPEALAVARARLTSSGLITQRVETGGRVSPDGRFQVVNDSSNNLAIREFSTGRVRRVTSDGVTTEPEQYPLSAAFSADGREIAYGWYMDGEYRGVLRATTTDEGGKPRTLYDNKDVDSVSPTDWSPDGKWIAAVIRRRDKTAQIGVFDARTGALRVIKTVEWSRVGGLRFSPDSTRLAYHRPSVDNGFERDVFVIAVDGSRETRVADSPGDDTVLEWLPDGKQLLIASDRGGSMSAWTVPAAPPPTGPTYELAKSDIGIVSSLGLTREGVLYYSFLPTRGNIYLAAFDQATGQLTSAPVQTLPRFKGMNFGPTWSPDGRLLAYASRRDIPAPINVTRQIIAMLSTEKHDIVREIVPAFSYSGAGTWSADGRAFLARGADMKGRSGIIRIDSMTGETTLIVPNETCSGIPFWAADGQSFFCYGFAEHQIVQVDAASAAVRRTIPAESQGLAASRDGRYLVVGYSAADDRRLQLLDLTTGTSRTLTDLPVEGSIYSIDWTPDSRAVVVPRQVNGESSMWFVPIDGRPPHKIAIDLPQIQAWRFNPKTNEVALATDGGAPGLETWKMSGFLGADVRARR
jgi:Tol biopolymer transport system component